MIVPIKNDLNVYINNAPVSGLVSIEIEESIKENCAYEIFSDKPWAVNTSSRKYIINLEYYAVEPAYTGEKFILVIEQAHGSETYTGCYVKSYSKSFLNGKQTVKQKIIAGDKE